MEFAKCVCMGGCDVLALLGKRSEPHTAVADPVGFDEVRSNPPFLVRWRPFTTSLAVLLSWLNIGRYLFAIHSKRIARYSLVSVDQVRFCGELLFFSLIFFFSFFFFPHLFFFFLPSLSLSPGMGTNSRSSITNH